jgi:hypothetical protein
MLVQVVEVEGTIVSSGKGLLANEGCRGWVEVDGVGEGDDQIFKRDMEAVAREISVIGDSIYHGTRASACNR